MERRTNPQQSRRPLPARLLPDTSIVIPIGPTDGSWPPLVAELLDAGTAAELLLVAVDEEASNSSWPASASAATHGIRWFRTSAGRARQMNYGASRSTRRFVWFLHADSRVDATALAALQQSLQADPHALHYFDLKFQADGPSLVRLNALGARLRSRCLGMPFGDQGLCMSRDVFQRLGGFDESAAYGEDHLLVWTARRQRVPLRAVRATIATSARKYRVHGWLATTLVHGWRTWRQATPQLVKLLWNRSE